MKNTSWKDIAELIGIAAIVASLIFVGLQMRQTHEIALATLYQMRSDAAREVRVAFLDPSKIYESVDKARAGEQLTDSDIRGFRSIAAITLNHFENSHYLYTLGYLPEEHWEGDRNQIAGFINRPVASKYWEENRQDFRESFAVEVDKLRNQ